MPVETHEVIFSFDQPGDARHPLLSMLQQLLNRPLARDSRATALLGSQRVLIIDSQQERANYIAQLLQFAGYSPFVAPSSLDAYTLFLQGQFHPFAIILSEDSTGNNQFFLTRLSQQFVQRYDWQVPFIRLQIPSANHGPRSTEPLPPHQIPQRRPTLPLNQPGMRPTSSSSFAQSYPPSPRLPEQPLRMPQPHPSTSQYPNPLSQPFLEEPSAPSPSRPLSSPLRLPTPQPPAPSTSPAEASAQHGAVPPTAQRSQASLPSAVVPKFGKKQVEKISLDNLSIGRYQLKSVLGGNPIGDVYLTYDRLREQDIALKTIQTNMIPSNLTEGLEEDYNLFQSELDMLQQTDHPNLVRVSSVGKSYISGFPFIYKTMPYYKEGSLARWQIQFAGKLFPAAEVARVISQISEALQFLHNRGLLYQNFKMTNVLVLNSTQNMRDLHVALVDLPFVQDVINLPKASEAYRYYAPEQWENEAFTSSDQYGLAVLAFELLTGRAPFQGNSDTIMRRMHTTMAAPAPSTFNPHLSLMIDKVILRSLAKRPEERFESISVFAAALEQAAK
ncbi:MAG TPA: protein kinase [Ktedonobacteraceae bacterium]